MDKKEEDEKTEEGLSNWKSKKPEERVKEVEAEFTEDFVGTKLGLQENKEVEKKYEDMTTEKQRERNIDILVRMGFQKTKDKGDGKERYYYRISNNEAVGRTFNGNQGVFWAKKGNNFLSAEEVKQLPIVARFHAIREGKEPMPERPKEAIVRREVIPRVGKMIIPALNKTISELGLQEGVDYFVSGGKLVFAKEGELKLAAASAHRVHIEMEEIEAEPDKYLPVQLYVRLRGWAEDGEGKVIWQTEESNNWSYTNERLRFITKKIRDGKWVKDRDYMVDYNEDGTIKRLSPTVATLFELEEYMQDKQKYALRTIIGETKRRIWGEFLGVTQSDQRELEFEREEFEKIQKENGVST